MWFVNVVFSSADSTEISGGDSKGINTRFLSLHVHANMY